MLHTIQRNAQSFFCIPIKIHLHLQVAQLTPIIYNFFLKIFNYWKSANPLFYLKFKSEKNSEKMQKHINKNLYFRTKISSDLIFTKFNLFLWLNSNAIILFFQVRHYNRALITNQFIIFILKMGKKEIVKTAKCIYIKPEQIRKKICIVSKTLQIAQSSYCQQIIFFGEKNVPELKKSHSQKKNFKKGKNTMASQCGSSSDYSEFIPQRSLIAVSQTKNISTSYGKMIIRFMESNIQKINLILAQKGLNQKGFQNTLQYFSKHMFSVSDLRRLWDEQSNQYAQIMRIFSMNFLRKYSYQYIFNSRIKIYNRNLRYRHKIIQGVLNPKRFNMLKDF